MCKSAATLTCSGSSASGTAGKNAIKPDTSKDPDRPNTKQQKTVADNGQQKQRKSERERDSADRQLRVTISNDMNEPVFAGT